MQWVVAFHIIFVIVWFSGLFYLPRLFVYHAMCDDEPGKERFKVMERKLYIMTNIGGIGATLFGVWLLLAYAWESYSNTGWLHFKLFMVLMLFAYHIYCGKLVKEFKLGRNIHSHKFYRIVNEIPVIPLIVIVILVEVKPF